MGDSKERGNWGNWLEFLFSTIGCLVGLGNVWRFPYVCYNNGGAAFLIPYLLAMAVCGVPLFFLEMVICQFSNLGPGRAWIVCPLFRGLGYSMVVLTSVVSLYYNVIIAWALYYMIMSFRASLPWATCDHAWNTNSCIPVQHHLEHNVTSASGIANATSASGEVTTTTEMMMSSVGLENTTSSSTPGGNVVRMESSVVEFWSRHVLEEEGRNIEDIGEVRWQLALCLLAAWTLVFFCLFKDIKTSGKVVYVAAVLPYVVLLALLIRGSLLPGAVNGVVYYLIPQWHRLLDWQVWMAASSQVFYSAGIGWGGVATLASFNRFHNNVYRDALVLPVLDAVTSVFAGFVIFVYLGYMAHVQQTTVDQVVTQGTGLAFIAYPDALATMPFAQLWAVLFFLVLVTVGLDSQTITSAIADTFPRELGHRKRWLTLGVCLTGFVLGLPFVTQGGQYVLTLCDWYVASVSVMLMAAMECLVLAWLYGTDRLYNDIAMMIGYRPNNMWQVFWRFLAPGYVLVTWILGLAGWTPPAGYPAWSNGVGWIIALLPLVPVPLLALLQVLSVPGTLWQRIVTSIKPSPEWGPAKSRRREDDYSLEDGGDEPLKPLPDFHNDSKGNM